MTNLIQNPGFADGKTGWTFHASGGGAFDVIDGAARLTVNAPGNNVQLYQHSLTLKPATRYRLEFNAASNDGNALSVHLHQHDAPYNSYGLGGYVVDLSPELERFSVLLTTPDAADDLTDGRLRFWFAPYAQAGTVYWLSDVSLTEAPEPTPEPAPGGKRRIHVAAERLAPGDVLEFRYVPPDKIVSTTKGDIDWDATPWRMVAIYANAEDPD